MSVPGCLSGLSLRLSVATLEPTSNTPPSQTTTKTNHQRALSTKTEFFARVSHEFRTPLNIILGFAEEIRRRPLPPYVQERIGYIITSGESLLRIVDDILEVRCVACVRAWMDGWS